MQLSEKGKALIKKYEGLRLCAYKCPAGVWTIGYGHTNNVKQTDIITRKQADEFFDKDIKQFEKIVLELCRVPLKQGQFDALVSFTYNVGKSAVASSTLLKLLNQKNYSAAANQFTRWVYANGKKLQGLVKRREEERKLFLE